MDRVGSGGSQTALDRPEKRLAIYLRDDMACIYCGIGIEEAGTLTLDHVRPHSQGVPQDYVQAYKWINLAALRTTTGKLAESYRSGRDKLAERMTASQIAEAQRLAREWQPKTWEQLKDK